MYSPEVTIVAGTTGALILGLSLGFHLGKLYGMKLGIAARDFAESFGVGKQGVQAGVGQATGAFGGGGGGNIAYSVGGGGGGGAGSYRPNSLVDLYQMFRSAGMSDADAQKVIINEQARRQQQAQYAQALGQQKKAIP